jgi:hypothetical protein
VNNSKLEYCELSFFISKWDYPDRQIAYRRAVKSSIYNERLGEQAHYNAIWRVEKIIGREDSMRNIYLDALEKAYSKGVIYYMHKKVKSISIPYFGAFVRSYYRELLAQYYGKARVRPEYHIGKEFKRLCYERVVARNMENRKAKILKENEFQGQNIII